MRDVYVTCSVDARYYVAIDAARYAADYDDITSARCALGVISARYAAARYATRYALMPLTRHSAA